MSVSIEYDWPQKWKGRNEFQNLLELIAKTLGKDGINLAVVFDNVSDVIFDERMKAQQCLAPYRLKV